MSLSQDDLVEAGQVDAYSVVAGLLRNDDDTRAPLCGAVNTAYDTVGFKFLELTPDSVMEWKGNPSWRAQRKGSCTGLKTDDVLILQFAQPVKDVSTKRRALLWPFGAGESVCEPDDTQGLDCGEA